MAAEPGDPGYLEAEVDVVFRTDLQPETDGEGTLTPEAAAKILQGKIADVTGAQSRGSNIVSDMYDRWVTRGARTPELGRYREDTQNSYGNTIAVNPSRTLAEKLAQILPPEMMKASVLQNGDIRSLLQKIMIAPAQAERGDSFTINGVSFTANERAAAGAILVESTQRIQKDFADLVNANTEDPALAAEVIANFEANALYEFRDGVMHSELPVRKASFGTGTYGRDAEGNPIAIGGTSAATDAASNDYSDITSGGEVDQYPFFTNAEVTNLFATTYDQNQTVQTIYQTEAQQQEAAAQGGGRTTGNRVSVQYDDKDATDRIYGLSPDNKSSSAGKSAKVKVADKLTLTQMANKPREMSRAEIVALNKKMEAAGIYELTGEKPLVPGDWTDPAFKKAYERLMGMAVEQRVSMTSLLSERTSVYQKALEDAMSTRLSDPALVRKNVDTTARSMLGRTLSPEEHAEFTEFVHNLERRNAKVEAGLDPDIGGTGGIEDLDEGIVADIDARLSDKMRGDNLTEFSAERVQDQYDMFSGFLAGPGRGVG